MVNLKVVNRYVRALILAAGEKNSVDEVGKAVMETQGFLRETPKITSVLYHPSISRPRKKKFIAELLGNRYPEVFSHFINYVIDKKREKILEHMYETYRNFADQINGIIRAKVKSPAELSQEDKEKLSCQLEKVFKKKIIIEHEIVEDLVGGFQVVMGSYIIDGSVKTRLQNINRFLNQGFMQFKQVS